MTVPTPSPDPANRLARSPCQDLPDTPAQPPPGSLPQPPGEPLAADATDQPTLEEQSYERPRWQQPVRGRRLARKADTPLSPLTPEQRLLVLDAWRRSGLPSSHHCDGLPAIRLRRNLAMAALPTSRRLADSCYPTAYSAVGIFAHLRPLGTNSTPNGCRRPHFGHDPAGPTWARPKGQSHTGQGLNPTLPVMWSKE